MAESKAGYVYTTCITKMHMVNMKKNINKIHVALNTCRTCMSDFWPQKSNQVVPTANKALTNKLIVMQQQQH